MANPITWQNVTQSDWSNDGSANAALVAESLSGIGDTLRTAHEDKSKRLTGAAIAEMAGLTNRESYADDAAGIMGGLDQRYADMDAIAQFQQKRGDTLQNRQEGDLDIFRKQFENANLQETHNADIASKLAYTQSIKDQRGTSELDQQTMKFIADRSFIDKKGNRIIDEAAIQQDIPESGIPIKKVNEKVTAFKKGSQYYRTQAAKAEITQEGAKTIAKEKAKRDASRRKDISIDPTIEAKLANAESDAETQLIHKQFISDLTAVGMSVPNATAIADQGIKPGFFFGSRIFEVTDDMKAQYAAQKLKFDARTK